MAASAVALETQPGVARLPKRFGLWAIGLGGIVAAALSLVLALTNDTIGAGARGASRALDARRLAHPLVRARRSARLVVSARQSLRVR